MTTFGVIGYGSFGALLVDLLPKSDKKLIATSKDLDLAKLPANTQVADVQELAKQADVIFLSIPLAAYESVAEKLRANLRAETLLVDIASVKVVPEKILPTLFPGHENILYTHPLFGPQSAKSNNLEGLKFIVTKNHAFRADKVVKIFADLGAEIVEMSAEEHDKQMSYTHALTFFIAHALGRMKIKDIELSAPSYKKLLALRDLDSSHSDDLFKTIQSGNPFSKETRKRLIETLTEIDKQIDEDN